MENSFESNGGIVKGGVPPACRAGVGANAAGAGQKKMREK
jgi:hypothetical protein